MSSKKRPYRIVNEDTGAVHMVLAISQAQAVSHVARNLFTVTAASGMDVAKHAIGGGTIEDAGADESGGNGNGGGDAGAGGGSGDDDDGSNDPDPDLREWEQHQRGGIAARAGIADD